jgi:hypothetical protein
MEGRGVLCPLYLNRPHEFNITRSPDVVQACRRAPVQGFEYFGRPKYVLCCSKREERDKLDIYAKESVGQSASRPVKLEFQGI